MAKEKNRPGVMIYFEVRDSLQFLSLEDKGKLFDAILEYGEFGVVPMFDGMLGMAWAFMKPKLDADAERYDDAVLQRRYAVAAREAKKNGESLPPFREWKASDDNDRCRSTSDDIGWYPTTTPTTTTTTTPTTTATAKGGVGENETPPTPGAAFSFDENAADREKEIELRRKKMIESLRG